MLKLTGVAGSTAFVAGCGGGGGGNGNGNGNNSGGNGGGGDGFEIEPGTEIEFSAQTSEWEGLAPSDIEGESNPTLILQEGEDYTIGWTEGDGSGHNIEIHDDSGEVIDDLSTEVVSDEQPDDQMLDITASSEMAQYVCQPHSTQMVGDLQVEGGGGGGGNETGGNETGGNETGGNETGGNETGGNLTG